MKVTEGTIFAAAVVAFGIWAMIGETRKAWKVIGWLAVVVNLFFAFWWSRG